MTLGRHHLCTFKPQNYLTGMPAPDEGSSYGTQGSVPRLQLDGRPDEPYAEQTNKGTEQSVTSLKSSGHQPMQSTLPLIQVDYVVVFSLAAPPKGSSVSRAARAMNLQDEYSKLLQALNNAGLQATGRPGAKGKAEVLVLVRANDARVKEEVERERLSDWLHGITSTTPCSERKRDLNSVSYTPAERLRHVYNIITQSTPDATSSSASCAQALAGPGAGISCNSTPFNHVKAIFPPHDPAFNKSWISRWSDRSHIQGIPESEFDEIESHFGPAIAYYFFFLRFYFRALGLPAVIGSFVWLLGWPYSIFCSATLILWSIAFVESWAIKERHLAVKWCTLKCGLVERKRAQFVPTSIDSDPVTGEKVGTFPWWQREVRTMATVPVLLVFVGGLIAIITAITAVEVMVDEVYSGPGKRVASFLPTVLFVGLVPQLETLWHKVALRLVRWENHAHESRYDRSLTLKTFALNSIVAYAGLFLTAFVYVPFGSLLVPHLASFAQLIIWREEMPLDSPNIGASAFNWKTYSINHNRLHTQLFAYMVTNQAINAITEIGLPFVLSFVGEKVATYQEKRSEWAAVKNGSGHYTPPPDEDDERELLERLRHEASLPEYTLFVDFAEMATQFGYVVLWTVVWPIAPLFAFINNWFELRTDAVKLSVQSRRPVPVRTATIGPWLDVLALLSWFAGITNPALIYLFKPSPSSHSSISLFSAAAANGEALGASANSMAAATVDTNLARAASSSGSPYYSLRGALFSALLVAFTSEHGYFIARSLIRYGLEKANWQNSDSDIRQRKSSWELKRTFLATMNIDTQGKKIVRGETAESRLEEEHEVQGEGGAENARFWSRPDAGLDEVRRVTKTE